MARIVLLGEIGKVDSKEVGRKAIMLYELNNAGFPVPPAFVVTAETFRKFVQQTGIQVILNEAIQNRDLGRIKKIIMSTQIPDYIKEEILHAYESLTVSEELVKADIASSALAMIKTGREPAYVALRNSPVRGGGSSTIGAKGAKQLLDAIKACWCSFFNKAEEAKELVEKGVAVIVQKLVNASKCGILISSNPANSGEVVIKAAWGLGDIIEKKDAGPDVYILGKKELNLLSKESGNQDWLYMLDYGMGQIVRKDVPSGQKAIDVLTDFEIHEISRLTIKAEEEFGPVEVEFAIERGRVCILGFALLNKPGEEVLTFSEDAEAPEEVQEKSAKERQYPQIVTELRIMLRGVDEANEISGDGIVVPFEALVNDNSLTDPGREGELTDRLFEGLKAVADGGRVVWYRLMSRADSGNNPFMGWRGIRRGLEDSRILKAELSAVKRALDSGFLGVGLVLPLVTGIGQLKRFKSVLMEIGLEAQENIDLGVSVDTPASVQIIDELCAEGIDFIFIDIDSLAQLTFCADLSDEKASTVVNRMHPSLLRQVSKVVKAARRYNVESAIFCTGERTAEFAVESGVDIIVLHKEDMGGIREAVARREKKLLLSVARRGFGS
ncbi:MAG: PEP/pyruvate-binding domain-containing protein [Candidatus Woesearchaeota archaeon]